MTTKVDGLSWTALGTFVGFLVLVVVLYGLLHSGIHSRIDEVRADIADINTDVAELKTDMEVVIALLERVERGQSTDQFRPSRPPVAPNQSIAADPP